MKVVGLCGGSGSGKGKVCDIFLENGIPTIDTDAVYHELTKSPGQCLDALAKEFGKEIITEQGSLNRRMLSDLVFSGEGSEIRLAKLNKIAHYFILNEARNRLDEYRKQNYSMAVVDAPVLFESGFNVECDVIVSVVADRETRIARITERDSISRESAEKRIDAQLSDEEVISRSDYVIPNNSDIDSLRKRVNAVITQILKN